MAVVLEVVPRRAFAIAPEWPGWARSGRNGEEALEALLRAGPRYAAAMAAAGISFGAPADLDELVVVSRLPGDSGTEFGVPSVPLPGDDEPLAEPELERRLGILRAAWAAFDAAVAAHAGTELAKGPRGGGRDVAKIILHVGEAERIYVGQLGVRPPKGPDGPARIGDVRAAALAALRARALGLPIAEPTRVAKPWSPRRHLRRAAWHALDHAWEIEDRALPPG
jgi:hypothetical protein